MPQHHVAIPRYMGRRTDIDIGNIKIEENQNEIHRENQPTGISGSVFFSAMKLKVQVLKPDDKVNGFLDDHYSMDLESGTNENHVAESGSESSSGGSESSEEGDHAVVPDEFAQRGPRTACKCQVIRRVSQLSAGTSQTEESIHNACCSLIEKAEHFVYIEGGVDDYGAATVRAIMHWQYRIISSEKNSILHKLNVLLAPKTHDYISFYGLRTYGRLFNGGPVSTSQVYVHSKVMIVDDRVALIGSSNINDRSLLGSRDSEIGVIIEDKEFLESSMDGKPWKSGKFSYTLRCSLWSERLGLHAGQINQISDPVLDSTYKDLWLATAKENSNIYQDVFSCIPNDSIHSRAALRESMTFWKEKISHTTIYLGIAPTKLESWENGEILETDPMERLKHVRGHLVSFPLEFMNQEDLRPVFNKSEFYTAPQVFM